MHSHSPDIVSSNQIPQMMVELPLEVWLQIFYFSETLPLNHIILVCRFFNEIIKSPQFWQQRLENNYSTYYQYIILTRKFEMMNWKKVYFDIEDELSQKLEFCNQSISKSFSQADDVKALLAPKTPKKQLQQFIRLISQNNPQKFLLEFFGENENTWGERAFSEMIGLLIHLGEFKFIKSLLNTLSDAYNKKFGLVELSVMTHEPLEVILKANQGDAEISLKDLMNYALCYGHLELFKHLHPKFESYAGFIDHIQKASLYGHFSLCQYVWDELMKKMSDQSSLPPENLYEHQKKLFAAFMRLLEYKHDTLTHYLIDKDFEKNLYSYFNKGEIDSGLENRKETLGIYKIFEWVIRIGRTSVLDYLIDKYGHHLNFSLWEAVKFKQEHLVYHLVHVHGASPSDPILKNPLDEDFISGQSAFRLACDQFMEDARNVNIVKYLFYKLAFPNLRIPYLKIMSDQTLSLADLEQAMVMVFPYFSLDHAQTESVLDLLNLKSELKTWLKDMSQEEQKNYEKSMVANYVSWIHQLFQRLTLKWIDAKLADIFKKLSDLSPTSTAMISDSEQGVANKKQVELQKEMYELERIRKLVKQNDKGGAAQKNKMILSELRDVLKLDKAPKEAIALPEERTVLLPELWVTIFMYLDFDEMDSVFLVSKTFFQWAHVSLDSDFFQEKIKKEYPDYFKMAQKVSSKLSWKMMYESLCWERDQSQLEWINETIHKANAQVGFVGLEFKAQLAKAIQSENWIEVQNLFTNLGLDEEWVQENLLKYAHSMQRADLLPVFYEIFKISIDPNDFNKLIGYHRPLDEIKAHPTFLSNINNSKFLKALSSSHLNWIKFLIEEKNCGPYFEDKKNRKQLFVSLSVINQNIFQYLVDQGLIKKVIQIDSKDILEFHSFKHTLRTIYLIQEGCQLEWNFPPYSGSPFFYEYDFVAGQYKTNAMVEATIAKNRYLIWYLNKFKPNAHHANLALRVAAGIEDGHTTFEYLLTIAKPSIFSEFVLGAKTYQALWIRDLAKTDKGLEISFVLYNTLKLASNHPDYGKMMKVTFTGKLDAVQHQGFILQVLHHEKSGERKMAGFLFNDCQLPLSLIFKLYENAGEQTSLINHLNKTDFILFSHFAKNRGTCLLKEIIPYYHVLNKADEILDQILEYTNEKQFLNQAFCKALSDFQYGFAACFLEKGASLDFIDPAKQKTPLEILSEKTNVDNNEFLLLAIKVFYKIAYPHIPQDADAIAKLNYVVEQFDGAKPTWALLALQNPKLFNFMRENYCAKLALIKNEIKKQVEEISLVMRNQSGTFFSAANDQKQFALQQALQRYEEHIRWVLSPEFVNAFTLQEGGQLKM